MLQVSVIGPSNPDKNAKKIAYDIGKIIGKLDFVLITGGRGGVMEAASCGAKESGGLTVGILPGDSGDANPCVQIKIPTHMNELRNFIVVSSVDVVVSVGMSEGTLIEIAIANKLKKPIYSFLMPEVYIHLTTKSFSENELDKFRKILMSHVDKFKA